METARDQLAEALYQKGLALAEIESLKVVLIVSVSYFQKFFAKCFCKQGSIMSFFMQAFAKRIYYTILLLCYWNFPLY